MGEDLHRGPERTPLVQNGFASERAGGELALVAADLDAVRHIGDALFVHEQAAARVVLRREEVRGREWTYVGAA